MKPRALVGAFAVAWALALAACPQFESDFTIAPGAVDATTGDDVTTKATDAAADVGDTGAIDASSGDAPPDGSSADSFVEGSVDGGADGSSVDAPEEKPTSEASSVDAPEEGPALCCKVTGACSEDPPCGTQSSSLTVCCTALACGNAQLAPGACVICVPGGTCCPTGVVGACP
jgi:hypothetical protein